MKTILFKIIACILILYLSGCYKRNFFPDPDDPGLSLLTSHGFNIGTVYINGVPYINTYSKPLFGGIINTVPTVTKASANSTYDTLSISWPIEINDSISTQFSSPYQSIALLMPVPKTFTQNDFLAMNGQRFSSNTNTVILKTQNYNDTLSGLSNIYFVKVSVDTIEFSTRHLAFSGLFNGNIGDSILITKGRFDFEIDESSLNF
ncbi:MAG TPA: hypothetical protein VFI29_18495 [Hanamia sp.]|nr:hypothetical protein [Hanamia sp.]